MENIFAHVGKLSLEPGWAWRRLGKPPSEKEVARLGVEEEMSPGVKV